MKAKLLSLAGWLVLMGPGTAAPLMESVPVKLGPKSFRDGDVIQILEVESTSPRLEQGDMVTVRGKYRLVSEPSAILALFLTQTKGDGHEETDPSQTVAAVGGWHDFEATILVKHRGFLHLSFYDKVKGNGFGGVYFGTVDQVEKMERSRFSSRRETETTPETVEAESQEENQEPVKAAKLRYDYPFAPEVNSFMGEVKETDPNQEAHPRVINSKVPGLSPEKSRIKVVPDGDIHATWPPMDFRIENRNGKDLHPLEEGKPLPPIERMKDLPQLENRKAP
ncbi:MAG: hypothetical protein KDN19_09375 [Verrucomicrobiae bacterium]|nr:hypothetical protein [Verrucomicrobiae bacterium]